MKFMQKAPFGVIVNETSGSKNRIILVLFQFIFKYFPSLFFEIDTVFEVDDMRVIRS